MKPVRLLLLAVLVTLVGTPSPATADTGPGTFALEQAQAVADNQIHYLLRLTYIDDGHPARDATVTATQVAPDGTPQTPVPMERADQDGRYAVTLTFPSPGQWTVRFTSVKPPATLEQPATIVAPTTTTTTTTTTSTAPDKEDEQPTGNAGGSDGNTPVLLALVAVVAAGGGGMAWARARRRRR